MDTYFELVPKELILEIFQLIISVEDSLNFIQAFELTALFSQPRIWKLLFGQTFKDIDLSKIINIDYTSNDYVEYTLIYKKLFHSMIRHSIQIYNIQTRIKETIQSLLDEYQVTQIDDLSVKQKMDLHVKIIQIDPYFRGKLNVLTLYKFFGATNLIGSIDTVYDVDLAIFEKHFSLYCKDYQGRIINKLRCNVTYTEAIEFLMYLDFYKYHDH